jgi:hypothetical protein
MTSPTRLQTEQAIEHIGAYFLKSQDYAHEFYARHDDLKNCEHCKFVQTMADYIDNKVKRAKEEKS